jgi:hypothetical protein
MENRTQSNYLKVLEAFNTSTLKEIEERFGSKYFLQIIIGVYLLFMILSIWLYRDDSQFITIGMGFVIFCGIFYHLRCTNNQVISTFGKDSKHFVSQNKLYWRGARALLFFEKLKKENIDFKTDEIIKIIDKELELKKFEILKTPFFIGAIAVFGMMADNVFDKLPLEWLLLCLFASLIVVYFSYGLISTLRTEEAKINDLKLFIHWYEIFGKDMIEKKEKN